MNFRFMKDIQGDLDILYRGLHGIPACGMCGGVSAIGESAFPVAAHPRTTPVIAAARYGEGRIVVAGHEAYFDPDRVRENELSALERNILDWLTPTDAMNADPTLPIKLAKATGWAEEKKDPSQYPAVYADSSLSAADVPLLEDYILRGGGLVVVLKGWEFEEQTDESGRLRKINDLPLQQLLNKAGLGVLGNVAVWNKVDPLPLLTPETALQSHALYLLHQAKAIESGTLSIDELQVGEAVAPAKQKMGTVTAILSGTIQTLTSESPLYETIQEDEKKIGDVSLPLDKTVMPYTGTLLIQRFKQVTLDPDRPKSPYADLFPGKVEENGQAISNVEIETDLDYSDLSYLRTLYPPGNWQSTGLYAPAGSVITIDVPDHTVALDVQIGSHTDVLFHLDKWERAPLVTLRRKLQPGANRLSSPYGGLIYLIPTKPKAETKAKVTVSGAVQAPYFVLGQTSEEDWNRSLRNAPAPVAELQGRRIVLTIPSDTIRNLENPQQLMANWDEMIDKYDELIGVAPDHPLPHRSPDRLHRIVADKQISAGYMHAGYPIMIPIDPAGRDAVDFDKVRHVGSGWGFWHELGHNYQQVPWFWDLIVEVTVNLHSLHMQDYYGNRSRLHSAKDGKTHYDHAFDFVNKEDPGKNYKDLGFFERLVMIRQLQLAYGWNFYTKLHRAYRELPEDQLPGTDQQKLDRLVVMMSLTSGENLLEFFDKWGLKYSDDARAELARLSLPKPATEIWTLKED